MQMKNAKTWKRDYKRDLNKEKKQERKRNESENIRFWPVVEELNGWITTKTWKRIDVASF